MTSSVCVVPRSDSASGYACSRASGPPVGVSGPSTLPRPTANDRTGLLVMPSSTVAALDVLVACPGRLTDLIERGELDLDEVEMVVVDEADRMADMGFLPAVQALLDRTPPTRQTLLFSATLDGAVDQLVLRYQRDPSRH